MTFDRDKLLVKIREAPFFSQNGWSEPDSPVDFETTSWLPSFVNNESAMAVIGDDEIRLFLRKRITAAHQSGMVVTCVVDMGPLASPESLEFLSSVDAQIVFVDEDSNISEPTPLLKALGQLELGVDSSARRTLIADGLERCATADTNDLKGKRLEWLLHFMFSQISDFRVVQCNYRTSTEEIDGVVRLSSISPARSWALLGAPHILIEAKNKKDRAGQEVVSKLNTIVQTKRGTCRIGVIVSLAGFTSPAKNQVLKLATEDRTFVLLSRHELEIWSSAADYDQALDDFVSAAMLD